MRYALISLLILLLPGAAIAQRSITITPRVSYGSFAMGDMKKMQLEFTQAPELRLKMTDSFPAFYQFGLAAGLQVHPMLHVGMLAEMGSTGSRVYNSDYSGSYQVDQLFSYRALGAFAEHRQTAGKFQIYGGVEASYLLSTFNLESTVRLGEEKHFNSQQFVNGSLGIKPYVGICYPVKRLLPGISLGYQLNMTQPFHLPNSPNHVLTVNNQKAGPDWSGYRLSAGLGVRLF